MRRKLQFQDRSPVGLWPNSSIRRLLGLCWLRRRSCAPCLPRIVFLRNQVAGRVESLFLTSWWGLLRWAVWWVACLCRSWTRSSWMVNIVNR